MGTGRVPKAGGLRRAKARRAEGRRARPTGPVLLTCMLLMACGPAGEDATGSPAAEAPSAPAPGTGAGVSAPSDPLACEGPAKYYVAPDGRKWLRLRCDGLHAPTNPAIEFLQEPGEALSQLPDGGPAGNQVDWVRALREGYINPRTNIYPETKIRVLDLDIVFTQTADRPAVVFPHRPHTEWLDCKNCHPEFFIARRGANDFGMFDILQGEYCGRCHGAVSFPLTECSRCHSGAPGPEAQR